MQDRWSLAKVCYENPFDDTPRLVFADWLEERDQAKAGQRQREYVRIRQRCTALAMRIAMLGKVHAKEIFMEHPNGLISLYIKPDGAYLIGTVKHSKQLIVNIVLDWVRWIRAGKPKHYYNAKRILWVNEAFLLDACEAAGVKLDKSNLTLSQAGA